MKFEKTTSFLSARLYLAAIEFACAYLMRLHGIQIDQGTRAAMLLLKLGLIRLQHAYLAPAIKEEHNGAHPKDENESHDEHLLGAHYDLGACKESEKNKMKKERQRENKGDRQKEKGNSQFNPKC